ncbi:molybdopterin-dependent oxidoreductase [Streptacidiphilus sp. PB12-B1b]|uniref:molybdopterin-dependent oxidoreductase n=1 Tax=Streptacidiphilus sp. PB12-B1b TaxID=2705012 RepID=UPI001CDD556A|nr:molybdopterin-dependent oxidoreductase [Streptacidiphilus sp. PB12-B1b]
MGKVRTLAVGAATGLGSAAAALAVGDLTAAFTGPSSAPVVAVGSAAIDLTPTWLKDFAVQHFGTHDKTVLLAGIYATMLVLALLSGVLALRRRWAGAVLFALFAGVGARAAVSRQVSIVPSLVAGAVGIAVLLLLVRRLAPRTAADTARNDTAPADTTPADAAAPRPPTGMPRRGFLVALAGTAVLAAVAETAARALTAARYNVSAARAAIRLPAPAKPLPPVPASAHPAVPGLSSFSTPSADFYRVDTDLTLPQVSPHGWTLRVHGMVDHPMELSFDDLLHRPLTELDHTLSCVSNQIGGPYVSTTRWLGASLPALLREAGVRPGAQQVVGRSTDGMTIGSPLDLVLDGRTALLAVAMDGRPLPVAHGFPCRSVVPGLYGYASATKWLVDLEVTSFAAYDPYWVQRGWDRTGTVRTASRIEVPAPLAQLPAGTVTVAGTAWATHRGISAVEIRADGGPWQQARLATAVSPDVWRQWSCEWHATTSGLHTLEVRATDSTGAVQPQARTPPFPSGATGWHSVVVTVD